MIQIGTYLNLKDVTYTGTYMDKKNEELNEHETIRLMNAYKREKKMKKKDKKWKDREYTMDDFLDDIDNFTDQMD